MYLFGYMEMAILCLPEIFWKRGIFTNIPKIRMIPFILASAAALALAAGFFILSTRIFLYTVLPVAAGTAFYLILSLSTGKPGGKEMIFALLCIVAELVLILGVLHGLYDFHGLLGHAGHYEETVENGWIRRRYCLGSKLSGNHNAIAESCGGMIDDYSIDIDKDGWNELVCNTQTLADSHREALLYDVSDSGIICGTLDCGAFGISPEDFVNTEYDCAGNCFIIETRDETGKVQTWKTIYGKAVFQYAKTE